MLRIQNLVKRYGHGEPVLRGLDLDVPGESVVSIIGASGAGKSTLLRCINRLVEPTEGSIELNGLELTRLGREELRKARRRIGMIFQGFNLVDRLTVMENVQCGRLGYIPYWRAALRKYPAEDIERAYHLMERVGIAHYANKRADALSGGERQRVGVVRALMQQPEILLADEPTASLDPVSSRQIMELLQNLSQELSLPVLINIHNVAEAREYTQRIVGMRFGKLIFDGVPADLDQEAMDAVYSGTPGEERQQADAGPAQTRAVTS
ncbi:phosphonate ABC transporter ATP-binding protein [Salinicola sp. LHM]|uniref:phosphonate ABC transporter ATP-binding protein n=1 Tax=Salinicola sp. LHM TaxID=3065298 RepID=UPI002ACD7DC8|nr:phosphonate ABC transporter ATP-binding protein [Salinicola sp. LHM]MED5501799.1 phosphonate ABC transporter ATP-binding protein [Pseudomonadota bacterium]WQH32726.1 phosphonate ABC transporter ATP-binding protein [Salinicola sp. LHM]